MNEAALDEALVIAGFEALRRSDASAAQDCFTRAISARAKNANAWYGLSLALRALSKPADELAALDQCLGIERRHIPALIAKGDLHTRSGNQRAASSFYLAVLKLAAALPSVPAELTPELQRIDALCKRFRHDYEEHVLAALGQSGVNPADHPRFTHALDLLLGKRQVFLQQPRFFFYPELSQSQFFDQRHFPWVEALQEQTSDIRAELTALLAAGSGFLPYIQSNPDRPNFAAGGLLNNPDWSACYLIKDGTEVAENASRCPRTMAALRSVPLCDIPARAPAVLFSLLRPGTRIHPHHGFMNTRLICHLPLIVPDGCALRVGNETRPWHEGEIIIFDDTIEHEAWNSSKDLRVVLLFDVWRPELSAEERQLVVTLLESIDRFGPRREWSE